MRAVRVPMGGCVDGAAPPRPPYRACERYHDDPVVRWRCAGSPPEGICVPRGPRRRCVVFVCECPQHWRWSVSAMVHRCAPVFDDRCHLRTTNTCTRPTTTSNRAAHSRWAARVDSVWANHSARHRRRLLDQHRLVRSQRRRRSTPATIVCWAASATRSLVPSNRRRLSPNPIHRTCVCTRPPWESCRRSSIGPK